MKIKNSILALIVAVTTATISVSADEKKGNSFHQIISSQNSEQSYLESVQFAKSSLLEAANRSAKLEFPQLSSDFISSCDDRNLEDVAIIKGSNTNEYEEMQFVCKVVLEDLSVSERTFLFTFNQGKLDDLSAVFVKLKPTDSKRKLNFKAAVKHSFATLVSVYLSAKAAQRMFPGEHDKVSHARWSSLLSATGSLVGHYVFDMEPTKAVLFGAGSAWLIGFGREVHQGILKNDPNNTNGTWSDVRANQAGILIATIALRLSF